MAKTIIDFDYNANYSFRKRGNTQRLARERRKMAKRLNQRLRTIEKKGVEKSSSAYEFAKMETGRSRPRYSESESVYERMNASDLYGEMIKMQRKLESETSTLSGLKKVENKRLTSAVDSIKRKTGVDISKKDLRDFVNNGGYQLLNDVGYDSEQVIIDYVKFSKAGDGNLTPKQFVKAYNDYKKKTKQVDYAEIKKSLVRKSEQKRKQAERRTNKK